MIREVEMLAQSIAELKEFYVDSLGLALITENSTSFSVKVGESSLSFTESGQSAQPFYHFAFNIPENQIGEAVRWITPKAAIIPDQGKQVVYFKAWNAESIYFHDPAGNLVELIARHHLNNSTDQLFSQASLLCVSEIGLPVPDVDNALLELSHAGILPWQDYNSSFAAAGDEQGLLIVVKEGRVWFMSDQEAFPHTLTVQTDVCEVTLDPWNGMKVSAKR
ncbi:glyoxalase/bleomycin resistance/dioxygenase family protein [Paenibacillus tritici]|uniref:VOC family protein n=1 Tax=Paenibacillus tritici TaxID=1873425 RepID=UPI001BA8B63B|nr:glyoxalase/bleomycin resistance/dioxygenase family protein [Paenibacillus tritici]QUL54345.1 glyoxalase/bleomycin resistance/dioxygenase family protein [Paenibacillus tritici]